MASLRELQDMCKVKGIKFKGKTKAQLLDALKANDDAQEVSEENGLEKKSIRELRDLCANDGLSRVGTKSELIKRLVSFMNDNVEGRRVVNWNERGRKNVKKPVENVDIDAVESVESDDVYVNSMEDRRMEYL